jgi:hypothetical protein
VTWQDAATDEPRRGSWRSVSGESGHAGFLAGGGSPGGARPEETAIASNRVESARDLVIGLDPDHEIVRAKKAIAACRARFAELDDYTCTFFKREVVNGVLTPHHVMIMKARPRPHSIYFKFLKPTRGREAIYVAGRHGNRLLAHDVGVFRVLAGTLALDPKGDFAMEDCRHPITEAGLGHLIDTVAERWEVEMLPGQMQVEINGNVRVGDRACTLIESVHPLRKPGYAFHKVRLFIDREHGLPIHFEAYDWPARAGEAAPLLEEYSYKNLAVNVGLRDADFDPKNSAYSFGRF